MILSAEPLALVERFLEFAHSVEDLLETWNFAVEHFLLHSGVVTSPVSHLI